MQRQEKQTAKHEIIKNLKNNTQKNNGNWKMCEYLYKIRNLVL